MSAPERYEEILYEADGHVGIITLNRPEVHNALTYQTYRELEDAVRTTEARCLVITGAGRSFCAGDDVKQVLSKVGDRIDDDLPRPAITPASTLR